MGMAQRRMAAKIMKCGLGRIWIDPARTNDVEEAIISTDVRKLIKDGVIKKMPLKGISNFRKKKVAMQKKKRRRSGHGTRKGNKSGTKKRKWMSNIRAQRKLLKELRNSGKIAKKTYRTMYRMAKSGFFRSRSHIMVHLERSGLLKEEKKNVQEKA